MTQSDEQMNSYPIDTESAVEMARLIDQATLFAQAMGGLLPETILVPAQARILDLACGPGGWALDMAYAYPDSEVAGVDISRTMVNYASAMARARQQPNVTFGVMNIAFPLDFSNATFDLVNARFLTAVLSTLTWPKLIAECGRILKPGGILCLSECEMGVSNSIALQRLNGLLYQALYAHSRTYSVDGQSVGMVHMLAPLLRAAGFQRVDKHPFVLDASYNELLYYQFSKEIETTYALLKPYLVHAGVVSNELFDTTYQQTLIDLYQEAFVCTTFGLTVWGYRSQDAKGANQP